MNRRAITTEGRSRRRRSLIWTFGAAALVAALLYWEQAALLYLLSTLAMVALLMVVAFSDLKGKDVELNDKAAQDNVASGGGAHSLGALPSSEGTHEVEKQGESFKKAHRVKRSA